LPARLSPRNRAKRGAKTAGAQSEDVPLFTRRRTGGEWVEVATLPYHQQAIAAQSRKARCKNSRSAKRCARRRVSERNRRRRRMGGGDNLALLLGEQQTPPHRQQAIATPRKVGT